MRIPLATCVVICTVNAARHSSDSLILTTVYLIMAIAALVCLVTYEGKERE